MPIPMMRILMILLVSGGFFTSIHAQNALEADRPVRAALSPFELRWKTESDAFVQFQQNLTSLKTAFSLGDQAKTTAYEALLQSAMRDKTQRVEAQSTPLSPEAKVRLAQMSQILNDFDGHTFQIGQGDAAAPYLKKLQDFFLLMEAEMDALDAEARR